MKTISSIILTLLLTAFAQAAMQPVVLKVASHYYMTNEWSTLPGTGWVTEYTVPDGKMLVLEFLRVIGESDDDLAVQIEGEAISMNFPGSTWDGPSDTRVIGGLKLASGWVLLGQYQSSAWEGEERLKYIAFGHLLDTTDTPVTAQSHLENPVLQAGQLTMTVATAGPAGSIAIEKSRSLQDDWQPVPEAVIQPTSDPNRQTATVPADDPHAFLRARVSPAAQ